MSPNPDFDPLAQLNAVETVAHDTALNMVKMSAWMIEVSQEVQRLRQSSDAQLNIIQQLLEVNRFLDQRLKALESAE